MNEKSPKDSIFNISAAPKRPQKLGSVQSIVRNEDIFKPKYEEITLSDDDDDDVESFSKQVKCPTCTRDMTLWTASRREIHTKVCEQKDMEKKEKPKKKLTETIEKDDRVRFSEPKLQPKQDKYWEVSKNNVKFARIASDDEANRRRKRPRSFAVVELAPKKCQCEVVTTLHSRFMDEFHFKSLENHAEKGEGLSEHAFQMSRMIEKLTRFEQLSSDMQKVLDDSSEPSPSHFIMKCSDGEEKCHKITIKHRTTLLRMHPSGEVQLGMSREAVRSWLTFVYTARMEWNQEQVEEVKELAKKYGPVGLESAMEAVKRRESPEIEITEAEETSEAVKVVPEYMNPETPEGPGDPEVEEIPPEEPDIFTSDDPFFGFGKAVEGPEPEPEYELEAEPAFIDNDNVVEYIPATPSRSVVMDSFDEWSNSDQPTDLHSRSHSSPAISVTNTKTPVRNGPKPVFGSHVKILKTTDVTPMPEFDNMDEAELKERMKEIGMRPKGKKVMIQMLKKAYATLHPEICTGTPTIRPLIRIAEEPEEKQQKSRKLKKTLSERLASPKKLTKVREEEEVQEEEVDDGEADKTLNISNDERDIGRICGDNVTEDDEEEEATSSSTGKNDLKGLREAFLAWLRNPQNIVLYEHILSLHPVSLEEMLIRLEKTDGPLGRIGKAKLAKLLEQLKITYQLPQKGGPRRKPGGGFKKRF